MLPVFWVIPPCGNIVEDAPTSYSPPDAIFTTVGVVALLYQNVVAKLFLNFPPLLTVINPGLKYPDVLVLLLVAISTIPAFSISIPSKLAFLLSPAAR